MLSSLMVLDQVDEIIQLQPIFLSVNLILSELRGFLDEREVNKLDTRYARVYK
jgi:hypothetical protein